MIRHAELGGIKLERDKYLRLVGADQPLGTQPNATVLREDRPPEHASPEAMLRWARAQRSRDKIATPVETSADPAGENFVGLAFARPVLKNDPTNRLVSDAENNGAVDSKTLQTAHFRPVAKLIAVPLVALAMIVAWLVWSGDGPKVLTANDSAFPIGLGGQILAPEPQFALVQSVGYLLVVPTGVQDVQLSGLMQNIGRKSLYRLNELSVISETSILPKPPFRGGLIQVAVNSPEDRALAFDVSFAMAKAISPNRRSLMSIDAPASQGDEFVPRSSYTRDDFKIGLVSMFGLIAGQDLEPKTEKMANFDAAEVGQPLIYVHHGLGVSPETVRLVMQTLSSSGYDRVFQVGVPFRIGRTNVRFYHEIDEKLAQAIAAAVIPVVSGPQFTEPRDFSRFSEPPVAGTIEVWLSDKA